MFKCALSQKNLWAMLRTETHGTHNDKSLLSPISLGIIFNLISCDQISLRFAMYDCPHKVRGQILSLSHAKIT